MSITFAEHILKRVAQGQSTPSATAATRHAKKAPNKTPHATYASVVLTMAMGVVVPDANAATDGTLASAGNSSSAKVGVSLVIPERIEAHGFGEVNLAERSGQNSEANKLVGQTSGCVLGRGSKGYGISVLPGSPYRLKLVSSPEACKSRSESTEQSNAWLEISKPNSAHTASTYGEALTLLITPE